MITSWRSLHKARTAKRPSMMRVMGVIDKLLKVGLILCPFGIIIVIRSVVHRFLALITICISYCRTRLKSNKNVLGYFYNICGTIVLVGIPC